MRLVQAKVLSKDNRDEQQSLRGQRLLAEAAGPDSGDKQGSSCLLTSGFWSATWPPFGSSILIPINDHADSNWTVAELSQKAHDLSERAKALSRKAFPGSQGSLSDLTAAAPADLGTIEIHRRAAETMHKGMQVQVAAADIGGLKSEARSGTFSQQDRTHILSKQIAAADPDLAEEERVLIVKEMDRILEAEEDFDNPTSLSSLANSLAGKS